MSEAYLFDALRTPRGCGERTGALYEVNSVDLLGATLTALQLRHDLDTAQVEDVLIGCVVPEADPGYNIARAGILQAGWSEKVSGLQLNRFGASGLEAVNLAAEKVRSGWACLVAAGGIESTSRHPTGGGGRLPFHDPEAIPGRPFIPEGVAADLLASLEPFSREELDEYAFRSRQRSHFALSEGYFDGSLIPIYDCNGLLLLSRDECLKPGMTLEQLNLLPPVYAELGLEGFDALALQKFPEVERVRHVHTTGNKAGLVDGAALVLVGSREKGQALGLKPRARIVATGNAGVDSGFMLAGPAPAARKALRIAGMEVGDIDLWECHESYAAVVLKFLKDMALEEDKVNVNGGAIALGHPLGATGAMLLGTLLDELERCDLSTGLVAMSAGGGMAVATVIERI